MAEKKSKKSTSNRKRKKSASQTKIPKSLLIVLAIAGLIIAIIRTHESDSDNRKAFTEGELAVHFIDVGQGDCIFIESENTTMLIDCGEASKSGTVIRYLEEQNINRLDYVVATHPHSDHMGGMGDIINSFDIGEFIMPDLPDNDIPTTRYFEKFLDAMEAKDLSVNSAKLGRTIDLGTAEAEIVAPVGKSYGNTNNYSVGIIVTHGNNSFMFSGDAEKLAEDEMINSGRLKNVTVYKAGHHGSDTSSSKDFIRALAPEYAVIMCGEGNSYGHPNKAALDILEKYTEKIYRTDLNGTIVCRSDGNEVQFRTER